MNDFSLKAGTTFPDVPTDFVVVVRSGYTPTECQEYCLDAISGIFETLKKIKDDNTALSKAMIKERNALIPKLRIYAEGFVADQDHPPADLILQEFGGFLERTAQLNAKLFVIEPVVKDAQGRISDIVFWIGRGPIPREKQALKVSIDQVYTVLMAVFGSRISPPRRWFHCAGAAPAESFTVTEAREKLSEYLKKLLGIARVGLMNDEQEAFASLALDGLKSEVVAREAGTVKNRYVNRLGIVCVPLMLFWFSIWLVARELNAACLIFRFKDFFLLFSGAAMGTLVSFSIRRVTLTFGDLALIEEDRLDPSKRIILVTAMTTIVGLLFWTRAIEITLGGVTTNFARSGTTAVLIGALCGVAERGLASAISRRADEFVGGIGGKPPPATG